MKILVALASVAVLALASPGQGLSQTSFDGEWTVTINSPLGPFVFPVTIVQQENDLTATTPPGPDGEPFVFVGSVDGSSVHFEFETDYEGALLLVTMTGDLVGRRMEGPVDFGGLAIGDWNATRSSDG